MTFEAGTPDTWPPPQVDERRSHSSAHQVNPPPRRSSWIPLAGLVAGVAGVVGALLPAFDGQRVGDPASAAYRIGVPLGLSGAALGLIVGVWGLTRRTESPLRQAADIATVALGSMALLLTGALLFSG